MLFTSGRLILATALLALWAASADTASAAAVFTLQSADFTDNGLLAARYAGNSANNPNCTGQNNSPALHWENAPPGTRSFALIMHDPEGANGLGVTHLVAYNIPASARDFSGNALRDGNGYTGGKNSPGNLRYHGPCPPPGSGLHHYTFTLIATDLPPNLPPGLTREGLFRQLKGRALGAAGLIGRFGQ